MSYVCAVCQKPIEGPAYERRLEHRALNKTQDRGRTTKLGDVCKNCMDETADDLTRRREHEIVASVHTKRRGAITYRQGDTYVSMRVDPQMAEAVRHVLEILGPVELVAVEKAS